ncbi:MAG TPA: DUF3034 family protein [Gammaproteobacteria bacterium]|nr:DUF3034 family protein [Gammaproteobacteria bacterium]
MARTVPRCEEADIDMMFRWMLGLALLFAGSAALAGQGRLLATGGVTEIEGQAGGGIVPWAVIAGYGTMDQTGGTAFITNVGTGDYNLTATGAAVGFNNRFEISVAEQHFNLGTLGTALGMPGRSLRQQILGFKLRLFGNVVYTEAPQVSLGAQYKRNLDDDLLNAVGAKSNHGVDVYLSATKLFIAGAFGRNVLVNVNLRATKANQIGLLGFGSARSDSYELQAEASVGLMLDAHTVIGIEYRQKPDNLAFAREDNWSDFFIAWFPSKSIALTAAYADLGSVATLPNQQGFYLSVQATF